MTENDKVELERWRQVGRSMWPWLSMLPMAGCDREMLAVVSEVAELLGVDTAAATSQQMAAIDSDACQRLADWFESSGWIRRLEKGRRQPLLSALASGEWLGE